MADAALIDECRQIMHEFYGPDMPVTSYIPQPPCEGQLLAIETLGMGQKKQQVKIKRINEHLALVQHNGITWVHAAIAPQASCGSAYEQASRGFRELRAL